MKASVIVFPGSNCDRDVAVSLEAATGTEAGDGMAPRNGSVPVR